MLTIRRRHAKQPQLLSSDLARFLSLLIYEHSEEGRKFHPEVGVSVCESLNPTKCVANQPTPLNRSENLPALTGIRAFAAFWVIALHFSSDLFVLAPALRHLDFVIAQGNFGVDLFFILSGFILAHVHGPQVQKLSLREYGEFIGKRFARIYPAYFVAMLGMIFLVLAADFRGISRSSDMYPVANLPFEFMLIQAWGPIMLSWNYPAWSVSAEWFAYLVVFPAGYWMLFHVSQVKWILIAYTAGFFALLAILPRTDGLPHGLVRVSCEFLAGCALYGLRDPFLKFPKLAAGLLVANMILLFMAFLHPIPLPGGLWLIVPACLGVIVLAVSVPENRLTRILCLGPVVYLGSISYSLYLTHALSQRVLKVLLPAQQFETSPPWVRLSVLALYLVALIAPAAVLYHLVEEPARRFLRRVVVRKKSLQPPKGSCK